MSKSQFYEVTIDKLVHGGQGIGTLQNGKKALVWNVLPGEKVQFETTKSKSKYVEGIAKEILQTSPEREAPRDDQYLSTSPWQMMTYGAENRYKREILTETLQRGGVDVGDEIEFLSPKDPWRYRNKMEYSFFGDDAGLHLALYSRGTHRKQIVTGSSIARPEIDRIANRICEILNKRQIRAGDLKTLIVRCSQSGECVAALFTRAQGFPEIDELKDVAKGVVVFYSDPKSPASVATAELQRYGEVDLTDRLLETDVQYDVLSFFQGNVESYQQALKTMQSAISKDSVVTDMYAGVGSIGITIAQGKLTLVEVDPYSVAMARKNVLQLGRKEVHVVESASERATDYIPSGNGQVVVVDPPRAGLHKKVIDAILDKRPAQMLYLSCNPGTLARDLALLQEAYNIKEIKGYNFFPRTPHIEALALLQLN